MLIKKKLGKRYDSMMGRCYRESDKSYKNYGLLGVRVCSEWIQDINSFRNWFLQELINKNISLEEFQINSAKYELDRINPHAHYTPLNCRIVDKQTGSRNQRRNSGRKIISAEGDTFIFGELTKKENK